jgi:hypothetical protein
MSALGSKAAALRRQSATELLCSAELHFRFRCYRTPIFANTKRDPQLFELRDDRSALGA